MPNLLIYKQGDEDSDKKKKMGDEDDRPFPPSPSSTSQVVTKNEKELTFIEIENTSNQAMSNSFGRRMQYQTR